MKKNNLEKENCPRAIIEKSLNRTSKDKFFIDMVCDCKEGEKCTKDKKKCWKIYKGNSIDIAMGLMKCT